MQKAWKRFWAALASAFAAMLNLMEAAEVVTKGVKESAEFGNEKATHKREKKRAKWQASLTP